MRPTISFIIPVLNEEPAIAGLLRALRRSCPHGQLIVVDGGSSDGTIAAAMPLCNQLLLGATGRARQMNLGAAVASGDYLFFLHADTCPVAAVAAIERCLQQQRPNWGFCRVQLSGGHRAFRVIEWCMNQRSRLTRIATGDQMLFVARPVFHATGGFDDIPLMEDIAYCKRLRAMAPPAIVAASVVTSSRRWEQGGVLSTVLRMWCLRLAYFLGVAPQTLWRYYYGR
jgi:rSAM/selenodomain-associated transferase 2